MISDSYRNRKHLSQSLGYYIGQYHLFILQQRLNNWLNGDIDFFHELWAFWDQCHKYPEVAKRSLILAASRVDSMKKQPHQPVLTRSSTCKEAILFPPHSPLLKYTLLVIFIILDQSNNFSCYNTHLYCK